MAFNIYLTILIATIASFVFGWIWYGPLFGKKWMKLSKLSKKDLESGKNDMFKLMGIRFVSTIITVYVISTLAASLALFNVSGVLTFSFLVWLGLIFTTTLIDGFLWEKKSLQLVFLNGAYWLLNLTIISLIVVLL